ncbi:MAG: hypothetical protein NTW59_04380 [Candidatus Diapherotrites archaeon]|nr:hypothetical protein [Candidatus Diapherotrites archaeon]
MHKWTFLLLLVLFAGSAGAKTLFERSFAEMGYNDFAVEGPEMVGCEQAQFLLPLDINAENPSVYPIFSLAVQFYPVQEGAADVNVNLNGSRIAELRVADFKCHDGACWARIALPTGELDLQKENALDICMGTSDSITKTVLAGNSMVGLYNTVDFEAKGAFITSAEKESLVIGEKTKITVFLHNEGSAAAFAEVRFARPLAEDKNAFVVVEGNTEENGFVKPGESMVITYVIKPRVATRITLPPAIVYYKNEFGEEEQRFGNLVSLDVREPDRKIEAFIVKPVEVNTVGQPIDLRLAVKNIGMDDLYDLRIDLQMPGGVTLLSMPDREAPLVSSKETAYLPFTVASGSAGRFPIGCTVTYTDVNLTEAKCQGSFVEFKEKEISPAIYAGIVLLIIAAGVYYYLMREKPVE